MQALSNDRRTMAEMYEYKVKLIVNITGNGGMESGMINADKLRQGVASEVLVGMEMSINQEFNRGQLVEVDDMIADGNADSLQFENDLNLQGLTSQAVVAVSDMLAKEAKRNQFLSNTWLQQIARVTVKGSSVETS